MNKLEILARDLPSPETARRFFDQLSERHPSAVARLQKNDGLLSDVLTLASYSPLLGTTLVQNPEYISWLARKRADTSTRGKEEMLESLARFELTNSRLEPNVLFARFRRRELLRIFLRDIRRLGTIAEITEEISNLADTILEHALRLARQEMDNRYGPPFEVDSKGRQRPSDLAVVSLGKLGSKELNYSSDIDLLFIYSAEGSTTGTGSRGSLTNREYFVKLSEFIVQLVGRQGGEGAAYRVDMRLRPQGRVGALALSRKETANYYLREARDWEQQVLIRSRASAGNTAIFKTFFSEVEHAVFKPGRDVVEALSGVRRSKEMIDQKHRAGSSFDVKVGRGGIREIEFIAQALQLAYGGSDRWLRVPHTLISIARLADRNYLTEDDRSQLSAGYEFLRRLEHILQMEHGLQTHSVPGDTEKIELIAAKMRCSGTREFEAAVKEHANNVHGIFVRIFDGNAVDAVHEMSASPGPYQPPPDNVPDAAETEARLVASIEKLQRFSKLNKAQLAVVRRVSEVSPKFAAMIASMPWLAPTLAVPDKSLLDRDYHAAYESEIDLNDGHGSILRTMRTTWSRLLLEIAIADIYETITVSEARRLQTGLAEASILTAMRASLKDVSPRREPLAFPTVLAFGKLGSGTLDYDSDLDVMIAYQDESQGEHASSAEIYSRVVERFVTLLSSMTREGSLYRVDLRLRPYGKNGPNVTTVNALIEYIEQNASIWELLAYVQLRAVGPDALAAADIESTIGQSIAARVRRENPAEIKRAAREMRLRLEQAHAKSPGTRETDIKFGPGGLLDIYFITRYLQLVHNDAISPDARSTSAKLDALLHAGLLTSADLAALRDGHEFLSILDHSIRLTLARSSRYPRANQPAFTRITTRLNLPSTEILTQTLTLHRINVRESFDRILND